MRIDSYMTPEEAQKWWRANGGEWTGTVYRRDYFPVHNTPQELYRLKKRIPSDRVVRAIHSRDNLYKFEAGKLKKVSDITWIRLASFYGIHVKSLEVMSTTVWWGKYLAAYDAHDGEPEHRRIRLAATEVLNENIAVLDSNKKKREAKVPNHPVMWYKQASICRGGIY